MSVLRGLITVARVFRSVVEAGKHAMLDVAGTRDDKVPHWQPYGFQSAPLDGAIAVQIAVGGSAESLATIQVHDRRFTFSLVEGEVVMADDQGHYVWLKRSGLVLEAPSIKLGASATLGVARATDPVGPSAGMTAWMTAVSGYINTAAPGTVTPALPVGAVGAITTGSTVTKSG